MIYLDSIRRAEVACWDEITQYVRIVGESLVNKSNQSVETVKANWHIPTGRGVIHLRFLLTLSTPRSTHTYIHIRSYPHQTQSSNPAIQLGASSTVDPARQHHRLIPCGHLPTYLSTYLPTYLPTYLLTHPPTHLSTYPPYPIRRSIKTIHAKRKQCNFQPQTLQSEKGIA